MIADDLAELFAGSPATVTTARIPGQPPVTVDLDRILQRLLLDAFTEAMAIRWERRARTFEAARPQPTDYNGHATADELAERDRRLAETAEACRSRAAALRRGLIDA